MKKQSQRRPGNNGGFTLVELMVVISIIAVLAAIVGYNVLGSVDEGNIAAAQAQIKQFDTSLVAYKIKFKKFPESLDALISPPSGDPIMNAKSIPMAVLAAILFVVAYNMGEWHEIPQLLKMTKTDISVWLVTFALTVSADLTVAVEVGMILAAFLYIRRVSATTTVSMVTSDYIESSRAHSLQDKNIPSYVAIFRVHGPLLFGVTDKVAVIADSVDRLPPIVIVRLRNMTALDATGLKALEEVADRVQASGRTILFCGAREQPAAVMRQAEFHRHVGEGNICVNILVALERAAELHKAQAA